MIRKGTSVCGATQPNTNGSIFRRVTKYAMNYTRGVRMQRSYFLISRLFRYFYTKGITRKRYCSQGATSESAKWDDHFFFGVVFGETLIAIFTPFLLRSEQIQDIRYLLRAVSGGAKIFLLRHENLYPVTSR